MTDFSDTTPFLVHLQGEHDRLQADVDRIEEELTSRPRRTTVLINGLSDLRSELARHFRAEEKGGCLEEAVCRCPRLSQQAFAIEREHPQLLRELGSLICRADSAVDEQFVDDFRHFAAFLRQHESAESALLNEAFGFERNDAI